MTEDHARTRHTEPENLSARAHRQIIGYLGLFLAVPLYFLAWLRPTEKLTSGVLLDSVSAYYYTGAVGIFVGTLFSLSLFLLTYRGYKDFKADRIVGGIGGIAALVVALFPTEAPDTLAAKPTWWNEPTGWIHYGAAAVLFITFIVFALWLFRKSDQPDPRNRSFEKQARNHIYLACGITMICCVLLAAASYFTKWPIFWPEVIAIGAFAFSWLVKGEVADPVVRAAGRRLRKWAPRIAPSSGQTNEPAV